MITEETVLIVGAGGSMPYGFPSAAKLRADIISHVGINSFHKALVESYKNDSDKIHIFDRAYEDFRKEFKDSDIPSIDYFINNHPSLNSLGKKAIILNLLEAERGSRFREDMQDRSSDWYTILYRKMISSLNSKIDFQKFCDNKVSIITFNYDRSLEHYLFRSLSNLFEGIKENDVIEQLKSLKIIHLYGSLGHLPWQEGELGKDALSYGRELGHHEISQFEDNIKIINEAVIPSEVHEIISNAKRIYFLGFGFDEVNLSNIGFPDCICVEKEVYSTTIGLASKKVAEIENKILDRFELLPPSSISPNRFLQGHSTLEHSYRKMQLKDEFGKLAFDYKNCLELLSEYL